MAAGFYDKFLQAREANSSLLCLGLDPDPFTYPAAFPGGATADSLTAWGHRLIDATADLVCAYKPNIAFYEQFGAAGLAALQATLAHVPPHIPVLLDAKRGDIGSTARAYARAAFEIFNADAVTLSPYLGQDSIAPFLDYPGKVVFVLAYTSNPSAAAVQTFPNDEVPLFLELVAAAQRWGSREQLGFVVGATRPEALARVRAAAPERLILAPGIGAQGGNLADAVAAGLDEVGGGLLVPVSRAILYANDPQVAAQSLRDDLNAAATQAQAGPAAQPHRYQQLVLGLYDQGCVKFGQFKLASGATSPYYIDLRQAVSNPALFRQVVAAYANRIAGLSFDRLAGIPYAALPIAAGLALHLHKPLLYPRKEVKQHGTGRSVEGQFSPGEQVVVVEDLITSGGSAIQGAQALEAVGLKVSDVVVLIDREQGGRARIETAGYRAHAVLTLSEIIDVLRAAGRLSEAELARLAQLSA